MAVPTAAAEPAAAPAAALTPSWRVHQCCPPRAGESRCSAWARLAPVQLPTSARQVHEAQDIVTTRSAIPPVYKQACWAHLKVSNWPWGDHRAKDRHSSPALWGRKLKLAAPVVDARSDGASLRCTVFAAAASNTLHLLLPVAPEISAGSAKVSSLAGRKPYLTGEK